MNSTPSNLAQRKIQRHLVITGPTASGKSAIAHQIAQQTHSRILNADPYQFYKELPILSNASAEFASFVGFRNLQEEPLSAGSFARLAFPKVEEHSLIVGSGLYLGTLLYGLDEDRRKGTPFQNPPRVSFQAIVMNPPREELYQKINNRVLEMWSCGAQVEAENILSLVEGGKISISHPALKAIGLSQILRFLKGEWSESEMIEDWQRETRRLAKRQWTWLRKFFPHGPQIHWVESSEEPKIQEVLRSVVDNLELPSL